MTDQKLLKDPKYTAMKQYNDDNEDRPDGAFMAMANDMYGWDINDWVWFAEIQQIDPDYK